ncbi:MAG: hypothetical protein Q8J88_01055 [Bacteroidales bacterium]|nr:hypothetical protein [Bacteroidales bacterium]
MSIHYQILAALLIIIVWFALRELNCWYWKVNRRIELQEETNKLLRKIVDQQTKPEQPKKERVESLDQTSVNDMSVLNSVIEKLNEKKG